MAAKYDPRIIREFANRLYTQATITIILSVLFGIIIGASSGIGMYTMPDTKSMAFICTGAGALVGGVIGFVIGSNIAFHLRLQAQLALCQLKIEENTRRGILEDPGAESIRRQRPTKDNKIE